MVTAKIRQAGGLAFHPNALMHSTQIGDAGLKADGAWITTKIRHVGDVASFPPALVVKPDGAWITAEIRHVGELASFPPGLIVNVMAHGLQQR
jgi:hypothetical protein